MKKNDINTTVKQRRVLLIDQSETRLSILSRALIEYDFEICEKSTDYAGLIRSVDQYDPDILILGVDLPSETLLNSIHWLQQNQPKPVVIFAEKDTPKIIEKTIRSGVNAYIIDDIQPRRLPSIIRVALARFAQQQHMVSELTQAKLKLETRILVDKAKGLIMQKHQLSEDEAYSKLRKMAMDKGAKLEQVAKQVIDVLTAFD